MKPVCQMLTPLLTLALLLVAPHVGAGNKKVCVEVLLQRMDKPEVRKNVRKKVPKKVFKVSKMANNDDLLENTETPNVSGDEKPNNTKIRQVRDDETINKSPTVEKAHPPDRPADQTSLVYLKRLLEHFITHEPGYVAVQESCQETMRVELYPLKAGWTVFIRYSGTGREERVDALYPNELSQFSERAVLALLHDVPISNTINRENVLWADSHKSVQRVKGTNHYVVGVGTQLRGGMLDKAVTDSSSDDFGGVEQKFRLLSPLIFTTGYRGRFENWGLEAVAGLGIGTAKVAARKNPLGGHIDFGGEAGLQLHFLRYFNPRGLTSFYLGSGSTFEFLWFSVIKPRESRDGDSRGNLVGAGLDVDGVFGWEFMRASSVQFFLQGELNLPVYVMRSAINYGSINTWLPGLSVKLGIVF